MTNIFRYLKKMQMCVRGRTSVCDKGREGVREINADITSYINEFYDYYLKSISYFVFSFIIVHSLTYMGEFTVITCLINQICICPLACT